MIISIWIAREINKSFLHTMKKISFLNYEKYTFHTTYRNFCIIVCYYHFVVSWGKKCLKDDFSSRIGKVIIASAWIASEQCNLRKIKILLMMSFLHHNVMTTVLWIASERKKSFLHRAEKILFIKISFIHEAAKWW